MNKRSVFVSMLALALGLGACVGRVSVTEEGADKFDPQSALSFNRFNRFLACGLDGSSCCAADEAVPTVHCGSGLGCNFATQQCGPCGGPGQPCCDGPRTAFSGKCYTDRLNPRSCDVCQTGTSCIGARDANGNQVTRSCQGCGGVAGEACCPPDVQFAAPRCAYDPAGHRMVCNPNTDGQVTTAGSWSYGYCELCGGEAQPSPTFLVINGSIRNASE